MMKGFLCVIIIFAFTVSSGRAQDISPEHIPTSPITEDPESAVTTSSDHVKETQTEPITTEDISSTAKETTTEGRTDTTTEDKGETSTDLITSTREPAKDSTTDLITTTTEDKRETITTEPVTTTTEKLLTNAVTTVSSPKDATTFMPNKGGVVCRIILKQGKPYYNWIFRVVIVPNICSYCCPDNFIEGEQCYEINPFFCNRLCV